jgi:hypothetical protein
MPFLDAKALETDPEGMAFLRSVIRPNFKEEEAASPLVRQEPRPLDDASHTAVDTTERLIRSEAAVPIPVT